MLVTRRSNKCKDTRRGWELVTSSIRFLLPALPLLAACSTIVAASASAIDKDTTIPPMLSPFGSYPNPLDITEEDRSRFSKVVKFPRQCWNATKFVCTYSDHASGLPATQRRQLATLEEHQPPPRKWHRTLRTKLNRWWRTTFPVTAQSLSFNRNHLSYIGRYDEDRKGLYTSELFDDQGTAGECSKRTVHTGLDMMGPVGTPVFALENGFIQSVGYNDALGDYGNVVVVEHFIHNATASFFALYGHLANASIVGKQPCDPVRSGQVLGWMGDVHEGGGWCVPHVHFQVALHAPETHDMPGVVCQRDRPAALVEYFDPRYVVGELY